MDEVAEQVCRGLRLDRQTVAAPPDTGQNQSRGSDPTLGPTLLLDLDGAHVRRQFAGHFDAGGEYEAPPGQLSPIAQVQVFGQRHGPPAARRLYALASPHPGGPVEVEEEPGAEAGLVLDPEVPVEQQRLSARQPVLAFVQVAPRRLHHAHPRVGERWKKPSQQIGLRDEVRVQDEEEFPPRQAKPVGESSRLVADSGAPPDVLNPSPTASPMNGSCRRHGARLIGRVVQDLDFEAVERIVEATGRIDEPVDHVGLVVHGKLHRHGGETAGPAAGDPAGPNREPTNQCQQPVGTERQEKQQDEQIGGRCDDGERVARVACTDEHTRHHGVLVLLLTSEARVSCGSKPQRRAAKIGILHVRSRLHTSTQRVDGSR